MTDRNMIPAWVDGKLAPVDKLDVHRRGLRHMAVSVFVVSGSKVLIQQRALSKYHTPGLWANTCCTHPHWKENPGTCARRRINEELGITGVTPVHKGRVEYRADVGGGMIEDEVVDIYVAEADETLSITLNPEEVLDAKWIDLDDLAAEAKNAPKQFTPWLNIYLENHRNLIFGDTP